MDELIEIKVIDIKVPSEQLDLVKAIVQDYVLPCIKHSIYIELWDHEGFHDYFREIPSILNQPLGPDKELEGLYDFIELDNEDKLSHCIAIIMNENWEITLRHELIHMICAELVGKVYWDMLGEIYKDNRPNDPIEFIAIALSKPSLIPTLYDKVKTNGI
jgi:hypothetical protein